uniref:Nas2 N-terminal domain-containing protein n=1 Tax=Pseudo-nitzschia delicatissima TaxID=44447 RepID=A0A7S0UFW8_9STRA|mmetsp:Transcript_2061/g.4308  ORF Transcript_2061/g.4308 Transcript_2061/m.4308 type:complete len:308 (+) Transcript_2061:124-1047(+)
MTGEDNEETTLRKTLASLDVQRKAMEHEADAIFLELTSPPSEGVEPMGIDTPLVDHEGYPRGDIDVYRARTQRNRFSVLKTDHKEIEGKIEGLLLLLARIKNPPKKKEEADEKARRLAPKPLPKYDPVTGKWVVMNWDGSVSGVAGGDNLSFENLSQNRDNSNSTESTQATSTSVATENSSNNSLPNSSMNGSGSAVAPRRLPFAKINGIASESPAEESGMKVGDLVAVFGSVNAENHNRLRALAKLVPEVAGEGRTIQLVVLRSRNDEHENTDFDDETKWENHTLSLRPRPFSGRGLLGCHIIPFD